MPLTARQRAEVGRLASALAISCLVHAAAVTALVLTDSSLSGHASKAAPPPPLAGITVTLLYSIPPQPMPSQEAATEHDVNVETVPTAVAAGSGTPAPDSATGLAKTPMLPGPIYYTTDQLSKRPRAVKVAELDPAETRQYIVSGKLTLQLRIGPSGQVDDVLVEQSDLPDIFAETVVKAVKNFRFTPGERDGRAVGTLMRVEVSYDDKRLTDH